MDYRRIALIAALAIVSYLLLLEWNKDYPPGVHTESTAVETSAGNDSMPTDIVIDDSTPTTSDSVPQVTLDDSEPASSDNRDTGNTATITVTTPVHQAEISLRGGDIVQLALPTYPTSLETPNDPFVLLRNDDAGIYIAQSGLAGGNGPDGTDRPVYQSAQTSYILTDPEGTISVPLTFTDENGVNYTKTYTFSGNDFLINMSYAIENTMDEPWRAKLFGQIRRDESDDPSGNGGGMGINTYLGAATTTDDDKYRKIKFKHMEDGTSHTTEGGWIAFSQHYFLGSWVPAQNQQHDYETRQLNNGDYLMRFVNESTTVVAPGTSGTVEAAFWAGPKDQYRLREVAEDLDLTIDYGKLWFVAQPIFWLLTTLNDYIGNYGWSIIAMTLVVKLALFYLSSTSYRSMAKMRKLTPQVNALKERYGEDKQKMMQAQMALWKKEKVNPMGGCLPMLLQMPVLIGIYWVLNESVELRHAPWLLWYNDLSAMDPYFVLPLIMGASMYVSQLMTPMTTMDPMQAKILRMMPLFFTIFFLWFPAGLVLYWLVSNVFNILHQWFINKRVDATFKPKNT